jgi:hypothetical protein
MDNDDASMNNDLMRECIDQWNDSYSGDVEYRYGNHNGIVEAVNAGIKGEDFDIVMAIADDFLPTCRYYDSIVVEKMKEAWPELDGAIFFNDGSCGKRFALLPILSRPIYEHLGYFFDPHYTWGEADRALTVELRNIGRMKYFSDILFSHYGKFHNNDDVYTRTRKLRLEDRRKFLKRSKDGYYVPGSATS